MAKQDINTIDEALNVLDEAAKEKKEDLMKQIGDRYQNIRDVFGGSKEAVSKGVHEGKKNMEEMLKKGKMFTQASFKKADIEIRKNPMPYLVGTAVASMILGYTLHNGKNKK